jgi:hypothetical protein
VTLRNRAGGGTIVQIMLSPLGGPSDAVPFFDASVIDTQPVS